jgi:hypothetical protein
LRKSIPERALRKLEEEICFAARRRGTEHAETREGFELEKVVSCGNGERWRTKLHFYSREPFDDHHRSTTHGAAPEIVRARDVLMDLRFRWCAEQLKTKRQESGASPVGQETEVADAHEAFGKQVQQEAAQEVIER